ncbi:OadG-related small transporter subunit [Anaeropeptidivorans aminofermentans]|nr:OadG-related small transporter subunit [Anaeropeptidivorans aminofermentans]
MNTLSQGFQVMSYGLIGVFSVLILFYIMILVLNKVFPYKEDEE